MGNPQYIKYKSITLHVAKNKKSMVEKYPRTWNGRPYYILEVSRLTSNLELITKIANEAGAEFILAFKAFALWKTFPIFRQYIRSTTASSLWEARMAAEKFGALSHTYSPAYTEEDIETITRCSSHLTFNSLSQYARYISVVKRIKEDVSIGLRINPEYSEVGTMLYNPCAPGTRFGITADKMPTLLPKHVEGFHCHCHCESDADVFERTLRHIEEKFSPWFGSLKWINFGGGHLVTRKGYDTELLIQTIRSFKQRYPHLQVIFEPGSAFAWQTGDLVAKVVDIVEDKNIQTAILNVSFTCHMPDCLEMPYHPTIHGAELIEDPSSSKGHLYRLGGNSCLSGDYMGTWKFTHPLHIDDTIVFEDMIHYTTVKTNMFNGITHPSIVIRHTDGKMELLRQYEYEDYLAQMD